MDKTAIRNFAIWARKKLIEDTEKEAALYGITEKGIETPLKSGKDQYFSVPGRARAVVISGETINQRERLARRITKAAEGRDYKDGYHAVMEEIAYTWFNRLIAIRFMEVNDYLPGHIRPLSSVTEGKVEPDLMTWPENSRLTFTDDDMRRIRQMKNENDSDALFGMLFLKVCNQLHTLLPRLFEKTDDDTELLLRLPVMDREGVVYRLAHDIPEEDWKEQVQIVGWMYQYYNTEPKNRVVNALKGKPIAKEDIPAATQIFTTDWVVKYIVDNSLGKYWMERHPHSDLYQSLEFYVPSQNEKTEENGNPEDIRSITMLDPCVGSGHFLTYAFDVFMRMYRECGYADREAARMILQYNLYGFDIDRRAAQLAYFSLMMKAREYDRRIFSAALEPHIITIEESNHIHKIDIEAFAGKDEELKKAVDILVHTFENAKDFGSLVQVPELPMNKLYKRLEELKEQNDLFSGSSYKFFYPLVRQADLLSRTYSIVDTNPPYLNRMNGILKDFVKKYYKDFSADLFSAFMVRNASYCKKNGYYGFMTPYVWMFIQSYQKLREEINSKKYIYSLIQFEYSAFSEATVPICSFVLKNCPAEGAKGTYFRLTEFRGGMDIQKKKMMEALNGMDDSNEVHCPYIYRTEQHRFDKVPGAPIAYWANNMVIEAFAKRSFLSNFFEVRQGLATGNNDRFIRLWWEISQTKCCFNAENAEDVIIQHKKWVPYNKGGKRRQWFGNYDYMVNWENDGYEIRHFIDKNGKLRSRPQNTDFYFKPAITWGLITSGGFSIRYRTKGSIHDVSGMSAFTDDTDTIFYSLGLLGSKVANYIFKILNPTINLQVGDLKRLPILLTSLKEKVIAIAKENIDLSKADWDAFETSWDFQRHPLMRPVGTVEEAFSQWKEECEDRFQKLKANEEELNRIFIHIYGLEDELTPEEEDKDVTVRKADLGRDIRSLISYGVGCILGRYSLDTPGLAYAGGEWDSSKYKTFQPDEDNIIPITDEAYFDDDMVGRFTDWLSAVYGKDTLQENLKFMAEALGKKGDSPREALRKYFFTDFFKDHCKTYQKRPIYWLFDSGKKNGFKALIYLHRYDKDTMSRMRNRYLHRMEKIYQQRIEECRNTIAADPSSPVAVRAKKEQEKFTAQLLECQAYDEKLGHLALSYITLDLDDGVKVNYEKAQTDREGKKYPILAAIK